MPFDKNKFMRQEFCDRTKEIPVEELACFFDGEPVWTVRGLDGPELAKVNDAHEVAKKLDQIAKGIVSSDDKDVINALRTHLGISDDVPPDTVRRIQILLIGSVEPAVERSMAVKLSKNYPIEFYLLTNEILKLTGQGRDPGKLSGSGGTPESEPTATCATSGDDSSSK